MALNSSPGGRSSPPPARGVVGHDEVRRISGSRADRDDRETGVDSRLLGHETIELIGLHLTDHDQSDQRSKSIEQTGLVDEPVELRRSGGSPAVTNAPISRSLSRSVRDLALDSRLRLRGGIIEAGQGMLAGLGIGVAARGHCCGKPDEHDDRRTSSARRVGCIDCLKTPPLRDSSNEG